MNHRPVLVYGVLMLLQWMVTPPSATTQSSLFDRIQEVEIQDIVIECDFDSLVNNRNSGEYLDGTFVFQRPDGIAERWEARIRVRGRFRRRLCNMPPLKVDFDKDDLRDNGLSELDEFKLVTHCLLDEYNQDRVIKEYLAYRMYQLVSPFAYRVQLARIRYVDLLRGEQGTYWGFLIEDDKEVRQRVGAEKVEEYSPSPELFNAEQLARLSLFQYLIGNADWSLENNRNVEVIRMDSTLVALPYDFDFSGLVNAPYAIPNPDFELESVRDRLYLGPPVSAQILDEARAEILAEKKEMLRLVRRCKLLDFDLKQEAIFYLRKGFSDIDQNEIRFPEESP